MPAVEIGVVVVDEAQVPEKPRSRSRSRWQKPPMIHSPSRTARVTKNAGTELRNSDETRTADRHHRRHHQEQAEIGRDQHALVDPGARQAVQDERVDPGHGQDRRR